MAWSFTVDLAARGEPRRQCHRSGFDTKAQATDAMAEAQSRAARGDPEPSRTTVAAYLSEWLAGRRGELRPSTVRLYEMVARVYVVPRIGSLQLRQVTRPRLRALYQDLAETGGRNGGPLSAKTCHTIALVLSKAFRDAVEDRMIVANPAERSHRLPGGRPAMHVWSGEQVRAFLASVAGDRQAALWRLAFSTGARRGELLGLRWSDVDFDGRTLSIERQRVRGIDGLDFGPVKTTAGRRRLALDAATVATLREHRRAQAAERLAAGPAWAGTDLVFCGADGAAIDPDSLSARFVQLAAKAGLPALTFHGIRHSVASLLLHAGVSVPAVAARLGHSSPSVTMTIYAHAIQGSEQGAADALAAAIDGASR